MIFVLHPPQWQWFSLLHYMVPLMGCLSLMSKVAHDISLPQPENGSFYMLTLLNGIFHIQVPGAAPVPVQDVVTQVYGNPAAPAPTESPPPLPPGLSPYSPSLPGMALSALGGLNQGD